jgi:hypothetical protein
MLLDQAFEFVDIKLPRDRDYYIARNIKPATIIQNFLSLNFTDDIRTSGNISSERLVRPESFFKQRSTENCGLSLYILISSMMTPRSRLISFSLNKGFWSMSVSTSKDQVQVLVGRANVVLRVFFAGVGIELAADAVYSFRQFFGAWVIFWNL